MQSYPRMRTGSETRRRARQALRILLVCVCAVAVVSAAMMSGAAEARQSITRGSVTATFNEPGRRLAEHVLAIADEEREDLSRRFPSTDLEEVTIDIADSAEEFAALSYGGVPDWGAGCAVASERRIVIRSPKAAGAPHDLRTLLRHELAHLAIYDELGSVRAPRWFHEGAASAIAGEWRLEESAALALGAWRGTLIPPSELERGFPQRERLARLAYAESYQAVLLLEDLSDAGGVADLVRLIGAEADFDAAVRRMTGVDVRSFDALVLNHLRERFGLALLMRRGNLLFVGAAVLVLIGAALRRRESRRRLERWEGEEKSGRERSGGAKGSWR